MSAKKQDRIDRIEQQVQEVLKSNLLNDTFASVALEDNETCQYVLRKITGIDDLKVTRAKGQHRLLNLTSKDSILDVYAEDAKGRLMNLELQRRDTVDHPRRTRYYETMLAKSSLDKGGKYSKLPDTYIVYISETDIWKAGEPIYPIYKFLGKTGRPYDDGNHVIYANTEVNDGSEVAELLQYFKSADPNDMRFGALSKRVRFLKTEKGGHDLMSDSMRQFAEEMKQDGINEGMKKGEKKAKKKIAKNLFSMNTPIEDIAVALDVGVKQVRKWI